MSLENPAKIRSQSNTQQSPLDPATPLSRSYNCLLPLLLLLIRQRSYHSRPCTH